jgi:hypothetical protein
MSMGESDGAAADGRIPSDYGVHFPGWPFRQRHLGQSEACRQRERFPSDRERLAPRRLVERGRQRHAGAVPGGDKGSCYGPIILPCRAIAFCYKSAFSHKRGIGWRTRLCVS